MKRLKGIAGGIWQFILGTLLRPLAIEVYDEGGGSTVYVVGYDKTARDYRRQAKGRGLKSHRRITWD